MRKNFFTVRAVIQWNRLPREVADATNPKVFKASLDKALHKLIYREVSLAMEVVVGTQ